MTFSRLVGKRIKKASNSHRAANRMKILCFTDSLGSGGAQRQLTALGVGLKERGHDVGFLVYLPQDHFRPWLEAARIGCHIISPCSYWRRMFEVRRALRRTRPDVVLAFLESPAFYAELAALPRRRFGLVVGERSAGPRLVQGKGYWIRCFHLLADAVVTNSHTNRLMLETAFPVLRKKIATIYNGVDLKRFHPSLGNARRLAPGSALRVVVAASYQALKNMENVARALHLVRNGQKQPPVVVDWYGGQAADSTSFREAERFVAKHALTDCLRFHPAKRDIEEEFACASAVGLFSYYEGLPNAVCEGMACRKPILLSDVCDAGNLVLDGENGFLCDPASPASIAQTFRRLASASESQREEMGLASRQKAEALFAEQTVLTCYERILQAAALRRPPPENCTSPAAVPQSAIRTLERWQSGQEG